MTRSLIRNTLLIMFSVFHLLATAMDFTPFMENPILLPKIIFINSVEDAKKKLIKNPDALHEACINSDYQNARLLIDAGADVNGYDRLEKKTPLFNAVWEDDLDMVKLLTDCNADVMAKDAHGKTPLHFATEFSTTPIIELLISKGAEINHPSNDGSTPLLAVPLCFDLSNKAANNLFKLIELSADINHQNDYGVSALHIAAKNNHLQLIKILMRKSADPFAQTHIIGATPLHLAAIHCAASACTAILGNLGLFRDDEALLPDYYRNKLFELAKSLVLFQDYNQKTALDALGAYGYGTKKAASVIKSLLTQVIDAQNYSELPQEIRWIAEKTIQERIAG